VEEEGLRKEKNGGFEGDKKGFLIVVIPYPPLEKGKLAHYANTKYTGFGASGRKRATSKGGEGTYGPKPVTGGGGGSSGKVFVGSGNGEIGSQNGKGRTRKRARRKKRVGCSRACTEIAEA